MSTMTITFEIQKRSDIRKAIHLRYGGISAFCVKYGIKYTQAVTTLRTGYCSPSTQHIKDAMLTEFGLSPEVWER